MCLPPQSPGRGPRTAPATSAHPQEQIQPRTQLHCVRDYVIGLRNDVICNTWCRFTPPDPVWGLSGKPRELVEALAEHADNLLHQLGSEVVTSDLSGSVAEQLLSVCVEFATTAARLAAYVF